MRFPPPAALFKNDRLLPKRKVVKRDVKMARVDRGKGSRVQLNEMVIMLNE